MERVGFLSNMNGINLQKVTHTQKKVTILFKWLLTKSSARYFDFVYSRHIYFHDALKYHVRFRS